MGSKLVEYSPAGGWTVRADRAGSVPQVCNPCSLQSRPHGWNHKLDIKYRFSGATCAHFGQYSACVIVQGSVQELESAEHYEGQPARQKQKAAQQWGQSCGKQQGKCVYCPECPTTDAATRCLPLTFAQLRLLLTAAKNSVATLAHHLLQLQSAPKSVVLDRRLHLVQRQWVQGAFLVALVQHGAALRVMLPGGKREVLLTTPENLAVGGESSAEAAVREVWEETGLLLPHAALKSCGVLQGMAFYTADVRCMCTL